MAAQDSAYDLSQEQQELLRFVVCGSVDDGKSSSIGRLLYDSKSIFADQLATLRTDAADASDPGESAIELAYLTDGLRAEREQGITIDVAYRYFATSRRRFIIADTPGHVEYTRNMITGASNASLAFILINAEKGVVEQTRRHAYLTSLLGIRDFVVGINKMDLVGYRRDVFESIRRDFLALGEFLEIPRVTFIPISALRGDNIVHRSKNLAWYDGDPLLTHLESVEVPGHVTDPSEQSKRNAVLPVQWIIQAQRTSGGRLFRGIAGQVAAGRFRVGDEVTIFPGNKKTRIREIQIGGEFVETALALQSVALVLEDEMDVSRGDTVVVGREPNVDREFEATLCWMQRSPLDLRRRYLLKHSCKTVQGLVTELVDRVDITTLVNQSASTLELNDIGRVRLKVSEPLVFAPYRENRKLGSFILIDAATHATAAVGMITGPVERTETWEI